MDKQSEGQYIDLKSICNRLSAVARSKPEEILKESLSDFQSISSLLSADIEYSRALLRANSATELGDLVRISCLFNDFTFFTTLDTPVHLNIHHLPDEVVTQTKLLLPDEIARHVIHQEGNPIWNPILVTGSDNDFNHFVTESYKLIESRRLIPLPRKAILAKIKHPQEGSRHVLWHTNPYAPIDQWRIGTQSSDPDIWSMIGGNKTEPLIELTLPFLQGINLIDLERVIKDEHELLSPLRSELRLLSHNLGELPRSQWREYSLDVIQPRIDRIEKRLKTLSEQRRFKLGGVALAAVTGAYCAFTLGAVEQVITAAGGALAAIAHVISEHRASLATIREDPLYFFWSLKRKSSN